MGERVNSLPHNPEFDQSEIESFRKHCRKKEKVLVPTMF